MFYLIKLFLSAGIIVAISEISKRTTLLGGLLASLPLISLLSFFWIYYETKDTAKIAKLSMEIFWLVLPSLSLFIALPLLLKRFSFATSMALSIVIMFVCYGLMVMALKRFTVI